MLARRRGVSAEFAGRAGEAIARHLAEATEYRRGKRIVVYAALRDELPMDDVVRSARAAGKRLLWPRLLGEGRMTFAHVERVEDLQMGRYGVLEPPSWADAETPGPDLLLLVPGVAFDVQGGRLGRGGGVWDRALANTRGAMTFGVGYELQVVARVPREEHDRPMDALLTEAGIRRFGGS